MIRRYLHRRWKAQLGEPHNDGRALIASFWTLKHWRWLDRYFEWDVRTYGEMPGIQPWWDRVAGRFCCWLSDWRTTLSMKLGKP